MKQKTIFLVSPIHHELFFSFRLPCPPTMLMMWIPPFQNAPASNLVAPAWESCRKTS